MPSQPSVCIRVLPASPWAVHWTKKERILFLRGLDCRGLGKKYVNSIFRRFGLRNVAKCFMNTETAANAGVLVFKTWEWDKGVPSKNVSELRLTLKYFTVNYHQWIPFAPSKEAFPCLNIRGHALTLRFLQADYCPFPQENLMTLWPLQAQLRLSKISTLGHLFEFHKSHNSCLLWIASPTWNLSNSMYWGGCCCLLSIANGRMGSTCLQHHFQVLKVLPGKGKNWFFFSFFFPRNGKFHYVQHICPQSTVCICAHTCHMSLHFYGTAFNCKSLEPATVWQVNCLYSSLVFVVDRSTCPSDFKQAESSFALSSLCGNHQDIVENLLWKRFPCNIIPQNVLRNS